MDRIFHVHIAASRSKTLYIGVTSNIENRIFEHREKEHPGFSTTYNCNRLVWLERFTNPTTAIAREKQLRAGDGPRNSPSSNKPTQPGKI